MRDLEALRADFDLRSKRSLSMPAAGLVVWAAIGILSLFLRPGAAVYALVFGTGAIFPVALLIAKWRGEELVNNTNPLAKLMGVCVLMVNLLWAVHIPLLLRAPEFVPLSLGVGLGLHWMVYSWIIQHPLGYQHAILRSLGLVLAWFAFPDTIVTASAAVVVTAYALTLVQMRGRQTAMRMALQ